MRRTLIGAGALALAALSLPGPTASAASSGGTGSTSCNDGTVTWSPTTLWPPNHKLKTIAISYTDNDGDGDTTTITVSSITDDQIVSGVELNGSGQPTDTQGPDWTGVGNTGTATDPNAATTSAEVRAERSGKVKAGRTYTISVTCSDMGGSDNENETQTVDLAVHVPHDQGH